MVIDSREYVCFLESHAPNTKWKRNETEKTKSNFLIHFHELFFAEKIASGICCHPLLKVQYHDILLLLLFVHVLVISAEAYRHRNIFLSLRRLQLIFFPFSVRCVSWKNAKNWLLCFVNTYAWVDSHSLVDRVDSDWQNGRCCYIEWHCLVPNHPFEVHKKGIQHRTLKHHQIIFVNSQN